MSEPQNDSPQNDSHWTDTPATALLMFTDDESERLLLMLGYGHGDAGFTKEDFDALMDWAQMARMNEGILQNVLAGDLCVCVKDGEVAFRTTPKGERMVEGMIANAKIADANK